MANVHLINFFCLLLVVFGTLGITSVQYVRALLRRCEPRKPKRGGGKGRARERATAREIIKGRGKETKKVGRARNPRKRKGKNEGK